MDNAISGLIGVALGAALAWGKDAWREWRERQRRANYLAIRVICTLDELFDQCVEIARDDGTYRGEFNAEGNAEAQTSLPDGIAFSDDIDWKSIDSSVAYKILSLPNTIMSINGALEFVGYAIASGPHYEEFFDERQYKYASLGLKVHDLAQFLRRKSRIPDRQFEGWDPVGELREKKVNIEQRRNDHAREHAANWHQYIASSGGGTNG